METIYKLNKNCSIREENDKYLLVNLVTQGLHFITKEAYLIVEKLDGNTPIEKIINQVYSDIDKNKKDIIDNFLKKLKERKLIEEI